MSQRLTDDKNALSEVAVKFAPLGIILFDNDGRIESANDYAGRLLELNTDVQLESPLETGNRIDVFFNWQLLNSLTEKPTRTAVEVAGRIQTFEMSCQCVADTDFRILYFSDVDFQQHRERLLEIEASTDELSGLANRRAFQRMMESHQSSKLSLAIIDIDNFKQINDLRGHVAGDDAIRFVGQSLSQAFEDTAIVVSRMGGDEFSVLCKTSDAESLVETLDQFRLMLAESGIPGHSEVSVTVSIGTVISFRPCVGSRELLTIADRQLYLAKNSGRNYQRHVLLNSVQPSE